MPAADFLFNTEDAILKGVLNSMIGVINFSFNPVKDILITCGGDSELITSILKAKKTKIINLPNLVLEGMIIHFENSK
jgi:type III pantothenate kinase